MSSVENFIKRLLTVEESLDTTCLAEIFFLAQIMDTNKDEVQNNEKIKVKKSVKVLDATSVQDNKEKKTIERVHTIKITPKNDLGDDASSYYFEKTKESSKIFSTYLSRDEDLPNFRNELKSFVNKIKTTNETLLDTQKIADYMSVTHYFYPVYMQTKEFQSLWGINLIIDEHDSMFLWEHRIENLIQSLKENHTSFQMINYFYFDSDEDNMVLRDIYGREGGFDYILKNSNFLNLVISDVTGKLWRNTKMFTELEQWSKKSFTLLLSLLPRRVWQKTPLRLGNTYFMENTKFQPKNSDLKSEDMIEINTDESKTSENSFILPVVPYEKNIFKNISELLKNKEKRYVESRVFYLNNLTSYTNKNDSKIEETKKEVSPEDRVEHYFSSVDIESKRLAIYASLLPLHTRVIDKLIKAKKIGYRKDAFVEFYFGGLLDIKRSKELKNKHLFEFHEGVRELLHQYIDMDDADDIYKLLNDIVTETFGYKVSILDLLYNDDEKLLVDKLGDKERELVDLLIKVLGSKGNFYTDKQNKLKTKVSIASRESSLLQSNSFYIGSEDKDSDADERPTQKITFDYNFAISKYPVTFEEYDLYCKAKNIKKPPDKGWGRGKRPVINITWQDANNYAKWLSSVTGNDYRLPSEAEWEYACRAGTKTKWSFGDDASELQNYAWFSKNSKNRIGKVGLKKPNNWGLYDMHGNIWEWCLDDWISNYRYFTIDGSAYNQNRKLNPRTQKTLRGGSWASESFHTRSSTRFYMKVRNKDDDIGFRLVRNNIIP